MVLCSQSGLHDANLSKLKDYRQCQKNFKKQHTEDALKLGKAASEIKYKKKEKAKPLEERVNELCEKIRLFVLNIWTDLRGLQGKLSPFLWYTAFD